MPKNNQKGQTLVVAVFIMLISLSIGITVSTRFFKRVHQLTQTDNANKAEAVAEALVEKLLVLPNSTIEDYIDHDSCDDTCELTFEDGSFALATLKLLGGSSDTYSMQTKTDEAVQVNLDGYTSGSFLDICWNTESALYIAYVYEDSTEKLEPYAVNASNNVFNNAFLNAEPDHGYTSCERVDTTNTPKLLRIKAYNQTTPIFIIPAPSQNLPVQGYLISSKGLFLDALKTVQVEKRYKMMPSVFDYVLYQTATDVSLSK